MKNKNLKMLSYIYFILPVIIFVLGWCKPIFSIAITIALMIVLRKIYCQCKEDEQSFITRKTVIAIFFIVILLCILAGHGGLFYQSGDWDARNAIFRDLINEEWPVYYTKSDSALVYYIGQWMVPAVIAKIFGIFSESLAWNIGNMALLIWDAIGVTFSILWVTKLLKIKKTKKIVLALFIFLFFSGLDIVGILVSQNTYYFRNYHLEWWAIFYQYSSMTTQLFWVFNQCIVPWIITLMFLEEKRVHNYLVLILCCLPYGPLPFFGLMIVFACNGICFLIQSIKNKQIKEFVKDVFSLQNMLALISILPIYYFYYMGNQATANGTSGGGLYLVEALLSRAHILKLFVFWLWEIGIYSIFLWKKHKKNPLFYTVFISLLLIPIFRIGYGIDFSMRASIPGIVIVIVWTIQVFLREIGKKKKTPRWICLTIILMISLVTPGFEYFRAFREIVITGKINCVCDNTKTYTKQKKVGANFVTENPKEDSVFFKYIARK